MVVMSSQMPTVTSPEQSVVLEEKVQTTNTLFPSLVRSPQEDEVEAVTFAAFCKAVHSFRPNFLPPHLPGCSVLLAMTKVALKWTHPQVHDIIEHAGAGHMLFIFRWALVFLKRELYSMDETSQVWEHLWSWRSPFSASSDKVIPQMAQVRGYYVVFLLLAGMVGSLGIRREEEEEAMWGLGGWIKSHAMAKESASAVGTPFAKLQNAEPFEITFDGLLTRTNHVLATTMGHRGELSTHLHELFASAAHLYERFTAVASEKEVLQPAELLATAQDTAHVGPTIAYHGQKEVHADPSVYYASDVDQWEEATIARLILLAEPHGGAPTLF